MQPPHLGEWIERVRRQIAPGLKLLAGVGGAMQLWGPVGVALADFAVNFLPGAKDRPVRTLV